MNEKEQLRTLGDIHIDDTKKTQDFEQLTKRVSKKHFHWQIPAVAISIVCIIVFLLYSLQEQKKLPLTADNEKKSVKVLSTLGDNTPSSSWQKGVNVTKDAEILQRFNDLFDYLQPVNQTVGRQDEIRTLKIFYSDGTSEIWQVLSMGDTWTFYNVNQQQYYTLPEQSQIFWEFASFNYVKYASANKNYWLIGCIILMGILQSYLYKKIKATSENIDQQGRFSTNWQRVNMILKLIIIVVLIFSVPLLHFGVIVLIALGSFIIDLLLENHYGKNTWRKWTSLCEMFYTITIFYLLFLNSTI